MQRLDSMRTVGGMIAVTAGIFGTLAAVMTLIVGLAGAFHAEVATPISWAEWGGVVFAFATVFLGAICFHARSVSAGLLLMIASVCGAVIGGMLVAMFMALTFIGGAVASIGVIAESDRAASVQPDGAVPAQPLLFDRRDRTQAAD